MPNDSTFVANISKLLIFESNPNVRFVWSGEEEAR